jgi:hypothetical protein
MTIGQRHQSSLKGIVSVRDRARDAWSPPAFMSMTGGSVGWQIGAQSVDLVDRDRVGRGAASRSGDKISAATFRRIPP